MKTSRKRWRLLAFSLLLLAVAALVRWHTPRPSSPADAWLWEQAERVQTVSVYDSPAVNIGFTPTKATFNKWLVVKSRKRVRELLRALDCSGDYSPALARQVQADLHCQFILTITLHTTLSGRDDYELSVMRQNGRYYLMRANDAGTPFKDAAPLQAQTMSRLLPLLRAFVRQGRRGDAALQLNSAAGSS